ncbi:helix-turn-helix domain-containing protein [Halobaculum halobium]|uniref:helix-turn-helix domain-containing protein n=1 Tax=Halobaculum halobium TaxID=3032281 RepID=UPI003608004B
MAQRQRERTIRSLFKLQDALREELTDRQWESLETAYSAGYFEWPREVSGEEVAALIGVSQPTFNKHLRVAERSAFRLLLDHEYPDGDD